jgi:hypothetical protein
MRINPLRSVGSVLGGLGVISLVVQVLEFSLVMAISGGQVTDMAQYLAVNSQITMLLAKLVYYPFAGVLGGYVVARVATIDEMRHAAVAAAAQTVGLIWGFTAGEFASATPVWVRIALVILMGPAMMVGAAVRARAADPTVGAGFSRPGQE